jgi:tryptophan-rich sensory protein
MTERKSYRNNIQKSPIQRFLFVLGMVFFLLYLALGIALIFWEALPMGFNLSISQNGRIAFGVLLIVYAFFRFVRLIQKSKEEE